MIHSSNIPSELLRIEDILKEKITLLKPATFRNTAHQKTLTPLPKNVVDACRPNSLVPGPESTAQKSSPDVVRGSSSAVEFSEFLARVLEFALHPAATPTAASLAEAILLEILNRAPRAVSGAEFLRFVLVTPCFSQHKEFQKL